MKNRTNVNTISVVVPAYNERANIPVLVERISNALSGRYIFEIIIVDDRSSDGTVNAIKHLKKRYPLRVYKKKGKQGKAYSLLEGFSYARYGIIAMIDGDLQYPPEAMPGMVSKINKGSDIVVANRKEKHAGFVRNIVSNSFKFIFGKVLHGLSLDIQSGLKVFRKEILHSISLNPTPWTFDLEFLVLARDKGYRISQTDIVFAPRLHGESKVKLLQSITEIGISAVKTKMKLFLNELSHSEAYTMHENGFTHKGRTYKTYSDLKIENSAYQRLSGAQRFVLGAAGLVYLVIILINWKFALFTLIAALTVLYLSDNIFKFFLIIRSHTKKRVVRITQNELRNFSANLAPRYTILCPLYKEWRVIPQFINAIDTLDYPKDKLQVLLLLEEDDTQTITKVKDMHLPAYAVPVVVPHSVPKTKPKACNYGLMLATGEYLVIYDAEDVPEQEQLKKAALAFRKVRENVLCIQGKLNFYNPDQNILTKLFTAEYSLWFDLTLPGLQSIEAPIPLGGTSNHFRTADLRRLQGWDAFNVAEDCDLGIRLAMLGYKTAMIDSTTYEEANSNVINWFWQRTRWIKGYMQSYLVHMRKPGQFRNVDVWRTFVPFQLIIGGKTISMLINPIMWVITITYFSLRAHVGTVIESFFPGPVLYIGTFSLIIGNFMYLYAFMLGNIERGNFYLMKYGYLVPFYWLFMSVAAWVSLVQLIRNPHYWAKTKHGLHLDSKSGAIPQVQQVPSGSRPSFNFRKAGSSPQGTGS